MTQTADSTASLPIEPLPGYVVTERIGSGGYGEVWKATAPGGVEKAVKTLHGYHDEDFATRELKALERIKDVRHPFILSLDRFEVHAGRLVVVMELAEMSLEQCCQLHRKQQRDGIPRDELISYLRDTAEALDYMQQQHDLQHLDIKPENLLLLGSHIKVADFGLVKEVAGRTLQSMVGGMTPTYAAPEIFDNRPSPWTDQYSLAIVFQEMLTGVLPFPGQTAAQLVAQHTQGTPRVASLPKQDRAVVLKALAKNPADRFDTCGEFVEALCRGAAEGHIRWQSGEEQTPTGANYQADEDTKEVSSYVTEPIPDRPAPFPRLNTEPMDGDCPSFDPRREEQGEKRLDSTGSGRDAKHHGPTNPYHISPETPVDRDKSAALDRADDAIPTVMVSSEIRDLPIPDHSSVLGQLQPTLVIGLGGVGGSVVHQLQSHLLERDRNIPWTKLVPMLVLDTDRKAINDLRMLSAESSEGSMIETHLIPLRLPQQYQNQSSDLLRWLSRRWLYNIPRSLHTRGYRPLGRLALIDNARFVLEKIESHLSHLAKQLESHDTTMEQEYSLRGDGLRVVIVSSTGGGTGSGIALDLAFAIRNISEACQVDNVEIVGHFVDPTHEGASSNDLAVANTYAFMTELATTSRNGNRSSNEAHRIMDLFEGDASPWDHIYLAGLGGTDSATTLDNWIDQAAHYLNADITSEAGGDLDACRNSSLAAENETDANETGAIRSFALATLAHYLGEDRQAKEAADQAAENDGLQQIASDPTGSLDTLGKTIEGITIHPRHCGHQRYQLVLIPSDWPDTDLADVVGELLPEATIRHAKISRPLVIVEAAGLSLAQVAAHLADYRPDAVEVSRRLYARNDIAWTTLPRVEVTGLVDG